MTEETKIFDPAEYIDRRDGKKLYKEAQEVKIEDKIVVARQVIKEQIAKQVTGGYTIVQGYKIGEIKSESGSGKVLLKITIIPEKDKEMIKKILSKKGFFGPINFW